MIGYLRGQPRSIESDSLILDVGGVGYTLLATPGLLDIANSQPELETFVYTQVRDDAIQLYGFCDPREKQMFLELIKVNGVGPKSALQIIAASSVGQIIQLIEAGDAKGLSKLPKIGKKTAEQIVLRLKGKLVFADSDPGSEKVVQGVKAEVTSALVNLGFRLQDVEPAIADMPVEISLEEGVRKGLVALTN